MSITSTAPNMSNARSMLAEFERELVTTRRFLERIPADRLTWKPHEKSMTVGQLALHMAQVPMAVLAMAQADEVVPPDFGSGPEQPATLASVLSALASSAAFVRETLPVMDDRRLSDGMTVLVGGRPVMSMPREVFLRSIMLNHWYHHRGQLGVYLRLLGAAVPSSYGPSGDESPF